MNQEKSLSQLLFSSLDAFVHFLEQRPLSKDYLTSARRIIRQFATFCDSEAAANPWQLRQRYLAQRSELRARQPFAKTCLREHYRLLRRFMIWYLSRADRQRHQPDATYVALVASFGAMRKGVLPYQECILARHVPSLVSAVNTSAPKGHGSPIDVDDLLGVHFEQRRLALRGAGYGMVMENRAQVVTRRHLFWLERRGDLPAGTSRIWAMDNVFDRAGRDPTAQKSKSLKMDFAPSLPAKLRLPLSDYLEHCVNERQLSPKRVWSIRRSILEVCRYLCQQGIDSFGALRIQQIDQAVLSLVTAPADDLLRRRQQVGARHSELRPFVRYLHHRGLIVTELEKAIVSPPWYRASRPPQALSQNQLRALLQSVDRGSTRGRCNYALLMLMATYGLRPGDIAELRLDDIHWRRQVISLVQRKTGAVLTQPLLEQVAFALVAYLQNDRALPLSHRHLFVSLRWPYLPLRTRDVTDRVKETLSGAGLGQFSARHLRHSVAVGLLRQGERLSTIQDVLGHRAIETTQHYAVTDALILRELLDENER